MAHAAGLKARLNGEQLRASNLLWQDDTLSALQVIAGAGSGKTTTLTAAVMTAIESGVAASRIAVITFSRRAAHELRDRLMASNLQVGYCGTMHALAWKLIRESGQKTRLLLHGDAERGRIARELFPEFAHVPLQIFLRGGFLSDAQRLALDEKFAAYLRDHNLMDFDTMISQARDERLGNNRFDAVFVDEFQDTSPDQAGFIQSLGAKKYFVVGDDWQSIYRFRGADVTLTRDFERYFTASRRVYLVKNYRSAKAIVKLGNRFIRKSKSYAKKKLSAVHPTRVKPVCFFTEAGHAETVWKNFLTGLNGKTFQRSLGYLRTEKVMVLVRTNAIRLVLEKNKPENFDILTIHKSKGLEFENVIVFGVAEHMIPHRDNDYDEEVRILYVALTRARKFLGFVGWEKNGSRSDFLPFLMRHCRLQYI